MLYDTDKINMFISGMSLINCRHQTKKLIERNLAGLVCQSVLKSTLDPNFIFIVQSFMYKTQFTTFFDIQNF